MSDGPPEDTADEAEPSDATAIDRDRNAGTGIPAEPGPPDGADEPTDGPDDTAPDVRSRLVVGVVIVFGVLAVAAIAGAVVPPGPTTQSIEDAPDPTEPPDPFVNDVRVDRTAAEGDVTVPSNLTVGGGADRRTVLIEQTGAFEQPDIRPFVAATTTAGHKVRFRNGGPDADSDAEDLEDALADADAYVLVAPRSGFDEEEVEAIREFTDDGGRLILLGSPDRIEVARAVLGTSLQTVQTDMRTVAGEYGIVFGNRYLYDTADHDATYRHVFAEPTAAASELELDRVVLPTATRVESEDATVLLRTPGTTELSDGGSADTYPVAVEDGNVMAVGNVRFLSETNHNVADTEEFLGYVVEFALGGR